MTCYHPLRAFDVGVNESTGKKKIVVAPFEVKYLYQEKYGDKERFHRSYEFNCWNYEKCFEDRRLCDPATCDNFVTGDSQVYRFFNRSVPIPCGKCLGCRIDASRDWATRMMLEERDSIESWFITLTYSPRAETAAQYDDLGNLVPQDFPFQRKNGEWDSLPIFPIVNEFGFLTLNKQDYVRFNKRLLKKYSKFLPDGKHIRFFLCGEYGEKYGRPHYHGIYFNLPLSSIVGDVKPFFIRNGIQYYRSDSLEELWPFGNVTLGAVTYESCSYVARYCTKKYFDDPATYTDKAKLKEFIAMSRNPGLGREWFDKNFEQLYTTYIINFSHGRKATVPKYFLKLLQEKNPVRYEKVANDLQVLGRNTALGSIHKNDKSYLDYLSDLEYTFKHSPKSKAFLSRERILDA